MSIRDLIEELPKLDRRDLEQLVSRGNELLRATEQTGENVRGWRKLAGTVKGLPSDMALNHDHYLHGMPKK